jgi:hypothetical protein
MHLSSEMFHFPKIFFLRIRGQEEDLAVFGFLQRRRSRSIPPSICVEVPGAGKDWNEISRAFIQGSEQHLEERLSSNSKRMICAGVFLSAAPLPHPSPTLLSSKAQSATNWVTDDMNDP